MNLLLTPLKKHGLLPLLLALTATTTLAQTTNTWTGTTSANWNTPINWSLGRVPLTTDDVVIVLATNAPVLSTTAVANSVEVQGGASLSITSAGSLTINGSKNVGGGTTAFVNSGTVTSGGQLVIGNTASVGAYGLYNRGTFSNQPGGRIQIDNSTTVGLANAIGSFTNSATVTIGANASVGNYGLYNQATFSNQPGGRIQIDNSIGTGLYNDAIGSFTNSATVTIGANAAVGTFGLYNGATFSNAGCGALLNIVANAVIFNTSSFSNTGTIIENASGDSNISYNGGLVQNLNGGSFGVTMGTGQVITTPGLVWRGCTSPDWNTPTNWSLGRVPLATDDVVIISTGPNAPVLSTTAVANSVDVQGGASLSIASAGSLTINGSKNVSGVGTTAFFNRGGTVTNGGQLVIGNTASVGQFGLVNQATFIN